MTNLVVSLVLGGLLGVAVAVVVESRRVPVDGLEDVARLTSAPVLGNVSLWRPKRPNLRQPDDSAAQLHATFSRLRSEGAIRTVVLTSGVKGAATSIATSELARGTARAGLEVLLVDADMRRPPLSGGSVRGFHGLSCALTGERGWTEMITRIPGTMLSVLPPGPPPPDPAALLSSERMSTLLAEASLRYELVLLKAPPVLRVSEGLALAQLTDAVIVVADEPDMSSMRLSAAVGALRRVGANLAGVVTVV